MNLNTFASLKLIMENLECKSDNIPELIKEIKGKCQAALLLIDELQFSNNSPHVQLATRQAIQYIHKALAEIDAYAATYSPTDKNSVVKLKDICSPFHAGLEIINNLNYK